jgi:hypothetical protein
MGPEKLPTSGRWPQLHLDLKTQVGRSSFVVVHAECLHSQLALEQGSLEVSGGKKAIHFAEVE